MQIDLVCGLEVWVLVIEVLPVHSLDVRVALGLMLPIEPLITVIHHDFREINGTLRS